jgi:hypothetical protein
MAHGGLTLPLCVLPATRSPLLSHHDNIVFERQPSFPRLPHVATVRYRYMQQLELKLAHDRRTAGENKYGVQGVHLNPLRLFLRTSMPFTWRILSAFLPA